MKEKSVQSLNQLLQGEYMAINALDVFIPRLKNNHYKKVLQDIQNHHRKNISDLAAYIQNIDETPHENLSLKGSFANMMLSAQAAANDMQDSDILEKLIEGEEKGIQSAENILRGTLDNKSRDIAGEILHQDRKSLSELKALM